MVKASDLFTNSIVAKAKGVTVSRSQLDEALIQVKTGAASRRQPLPPDAELQPLILQRLIQVQLLLAKATDADKASGKEQAQKRITDLKKQAGSDEMFATRLKTLGVTESELAAKMGEELTAEAVLKRELKASATDEEAKKFYDENPGKFETGNGSRRPRADQHQRHDHRNRSVR